MADFSPSFVNPSYATPEQLATQRAYAAELQKRSGQDVNRPTGALANMITALTAGLERNRANEIQGEAAGRNASDQAALITQLQGGQKADPRNLGTILANPMASPETRALAVHLLTMQPKEDVAGRPAYGSPATGVVAAPVTGGYQPGFRTPESAGSVTTTTPIAAPPFPGAPPPVVTPRAPVAPSAKVWGDQEGVNAGIYPPAPQPRQAGGGGQAPGAGLPSAPAPAASPTFNDRFAGGSRIDALAAKDRELTAEKERTQGGAKGESEVIAKDVGRAASAPETLKGLGIMRNTIQSVGDKMTFGPTAKFSNEARRVISNYAPGLVDEKALAGADAVEKLNLGLAGNLSQQLGLNPSDIYRSVASVPGNEKSKDGTLALINMMEQQARNDQYVGTTLYQQFKGNLAGYQEARAAYYANHPIVNPITGNPIEIDAKKGQEAPATGGFKVLKVH
jgi:hypothetical protein